MKNKEPVEAEESVEPFTEDIRKKPPSVTGVAATYSRGIDYGNGNFYPSYDKPLPDAISSATPRAGEFNRTWNPKNVLKHGRYFYYVEVNMAFDKNEHHDYSWYRGQPSVVWQGSIIVGEKSDRSEAKIIGHGHVAGEDGQINPDLTTLTTSLQLIEKVTASFNP